MIDSKYNRYLGFSGKKEKYEYIGSVAKDLPVIFTGSFQKPSYYPFFTGKEATVISSVYSRQTQFDIWQFEEKYHNKPVFISVNREGRSQTFGSGWLEFYGFKTDSLQTVNRMKINFSLDRTTFNSGDSLKVKFTLYNPYNFDIDFNHHQFPVNVRIVFLKGEEVTGQNVYLSEPIDIVPRGATLERNLSHFIKIKIGADD
jgi:hypothetical protein